MERIESRINTSNPEYRQNFALMEAAVKQLREAVERVRQGGPEQSRRRHLERGKLLVRDRIRKLLDPAERVSGAVAARGVGNVRRRGAGRRHCHRHRAVAGPRGRGGRQRRDGQGRHLLSDDGQEASARAGDRAAEPSAVRVPGRLGRRVSAAAIGGLSRPRALRAHLLQHGADVGRGNSAGGGGDGIVHGGRRLRAGDVRRKHHRARAGHDFPRRPAAGARGHRRRGQRRGTGRRRRAHAALRGERPSGGRRRACARDRALDLREPRPAHRPRVRAAAGRSPRIPITIRARSTAWSRATRAVPTRCAN